MRGSPVKVAVVGAGFSGAVVAREIARAGYSVTVFESRDHVGGNCHTARDERSGVLVHRYGPHIFHTDNVEVWRYVGRFGELMPFTNRVKSVSRGQIYSFPVNLHTINQFFGKAFTPNEARNFIRSVANPFKVENPRNFEEQALSMIGRDLYEAFFKGYTEKQWGVPATSLPASILKRLPLRFTYDDNYYTSTLQGMPRAGYTALVENILAVNGIETLLSTKFSRDESRDFDHVFYTGPLDGWFGYDLGMLGYRSLEFERLDGDGDFQGNAVINYPDSDVPYTRVTEHKFFAPWETHQRTVVFHERSKRCDRGDEPFYPLRLVGDKQLLAAYVSRAEEETRVTFVGRLATYRYIDMHVAIAEALDVSRRFLLAISGNLPTPRFSVNPGVTG